MNQGVETLLARMESNPDEFTEGNKWTSILTRAKRDDLFDTEELEAIQYKLREIHRAKFHKDVMDTLLADPTTEKKVRFGSGGTACKQADSSIMDYLAQAEEKGMADIYNTALQDRETSKAQKLKKAIKYFKSKKYEGTTE